MIDVASATANHYFITRLGCNQKTKLFQTLKGQFQSAMQNNMPPSTCQVPNASQCDGSFVLVCTDKSEGMHPPGLKS